MTSECVAKPKTKAASTLNRTGVGLSRQSMNTCAGARTTIVFMDARTKSSRLLKKWLAMIAET